MVTPLYNQPLFEPVETSPEITVVLSMSVVNINSNIVTGSVVLV